MKERHEMLGTLMLLRLAQDLAFSCVSLALERLVWRGFDVTITLGEQFKRGEVRFGGLDEIDESSRRWSTHMAGYHTRSDTR